MHLTFSFQMGDPLGDRPGGELGLLEQCPGDEPERDPRPSATQPVSLAPGPRGGGAPAGLSGEKLHCARCGWRMCTHFVSDENNKKRRYSYYVCSRMMTHGKDACTQKRLRAEQLEAKVWEFVSGLLKDRERLRAGLDEMIEQERSGMRGDPEGQTRTWLEKLAEADQMRVGYQELAAKGLMTLEELAGRLEQLDETRNTAHKELGTLKSRRETVEALERDRDSLLES